MCEHHRPVSVNDVYVITTHSFSHPFRYVVCKGLRPNIQDVLEHMFNANVRINKMKTQEIDDVMEVRVNSRVPLSSTANLWICLCVDFKCDHSN